MENYFPKSMGGSVHKQERLSLAGHDFFGGGLIGPLD
jgi:hypothetical protein